MGMMASYLVVGLLIMVPMGTINLDTFHFESGIPYNDVESPHTQEDSLDIIEGYEIDNEYFIENLGQLDDRQILYYAQGPIISIGLMKDGLFIGKKFQRGAYTLNQDENTPDRLYFFTVSFEDCKPVQPVGRYRLGHTMNFFKGEGPDEWVTDVGSFPEVLYAGIYPGIDLRFYFLNGMFKYDFIIQSGIGPDAIQMTYKGIEDLSIDEASGDLLISTMAGTVRDEHPVAYQLDENGPTPVKARFHLTDIRTCTFKVSEERALDKALVIDPGLVYSTYLGGSGSEELYSGITDYVAIAVDEEGRIYVGGQTDSDDFPTTTGACCRTYHKPDNSSRVGDLFVSVIDPTGILLYSTYIGGYWFEKCVDMKLAHDGGVLIVGTTCSRDFPTTQSNAHYPDFLGGNRDAFLIKLDRTCSEILFASYFGGNSSDNFNSICVSDDGTVFLQGNTYSHDLEVTNNAYCSTANSVPSCPDAFVVCLSSSLGEILYCSYLGVMYLDNHLRMDVTTNGTLYLAGVLNTQVHGHFKPTEGAYCTTTSIDPIDNESWFQQSFIMALNTDCEVLYATYWGGEAELFIASMDVTGDGRVIIGSGTESDKIPYTADAFCQTHPHPGASFAYLAVLDNTLSNLEYCSYYPMVRYYLDLVYEEDEDRVFIGGVPWDPAVFELWGLTLPSYIPGAFDWKYRGMDECFIGGINLSDGSPCYGTFLGGVSDDVIYDLAIGGNGHLYVGGTTLSNDFPITPNAHQKKYGGNVDVFVIELDPTNDGIRSKLEGMEAIPGNETVFIKWTTIPTNGTRFVQLLFRSETPDFNDAERIKALDWTEVDYLDESLKNNVTYYYWIVVRNSAGDSNLSDMVQATPLGIPSAPRAFNATTGDRSVHLNWRIPSYDGGMISGYHVYRNDTEGNLSLYKAIANVTSFTDSDVVCNVSYEYVIAAYNNLWPGTVSDKAPIVPYGPPSNPKYLHLYEGDGYILVDWAPPRNDGGSPIVGYSIYRKEADGQTSLLKELGTGTLSHNDTGLVNGEEHQYWVAARSDRGEGDMAGPIPGIPYGRPGAPTINHPLAGTKQVQVSWTAPEDNGGRPVTSYRLYFAKASGAFALYKEVPGTSPITVSPLQNGVEYSFYVTALNERDEGPPSEVCVAIPMGKPGAPLLLPIELTTGGILLKWQRPLETGDAPSLGFRVYRGTSMEDIFPLVELGDVTEWTDERANVTVGTTYHYYITAFNAVHESDGSDTKEVSPIWPPDMITDLKVTGGKERVTITWAAPPSDGGSEITGHIIMRGTSPDDLEEYVTLGNVTGFVDKDAEPGTRFYYSVVAVNSAGNSALPQSADGVAKSSPGGPTSSLFLLLVLVLVIAAAAAIVARRRLTSREAYPTGPMAVGDTPVFIVEEAFLVYSDGKQIAHSARPDQAEADTGLLSGALIAIQGIVQDGLESDGAVDSITYGENTIVMSSGSYVTLAAGVYGTPSDDLKEDLSATVTRVEERYGDTLENWDGDLGALKGVEKMLTPLVEGTASVDRSLVTMVRAGRKVTVLSAIDFHAGYVRLKVAAINGTPTQMIDTSIEVHYDIDMLRLERVEPHGLELRGDKVDLGNIKPGERRTVSFLFDPQICHGTHIDAHVMYYDSKGVVHREEMKRRHADVVCPIFFTREQANTAMLRRLIRERLHMSDLKVFRYPEGLEAEEVLESAKLAMGVGDIQRVREYVVRAPTYEAEVWYYGTTKVKEYQMVMRLGVVERMRALELFVASTALEPVTGFIAEFRRELQSTVEWLHPEALQLPPEEEFRRDMEERDLMIDTVEVEDEDEVVVVVEPPGFGGTD